MTYPTFEEVEKVLNGYSNGVHTRAFIDGVESERERVIKLLEDERLLCSSEKYCWTSVEYECECERTRALIKGESNG